MNKKMMKIIANTLFYASVVFAIAILAITYIDRAKLPAGVCPIKDNSNWMLVAIGVLIATTIFSSIVDYKGKDKKQIEEVDEVDEDEEIDTEEDEEVEENEEVEGNSKDAEVELVTEAEVTEEDIEEEISEMEKKEVEEIEPEEDFFEDEEDDRI